MEITETMVKLGYAERGSVQNFSLNDMRRMLDAALNTCKKCGSLERQHVNGYCQDALFEPMR